MLSQGHAARVTDIDTSLDGRHMVSVSADGTAVLWEGAAPFRALCRYSTVLEGNTARNSWMLTLVPSCCPCCVVNSRWIAIRFPWH